MRPNKKSDYELWSLIEKSISNANYVFLKHAQERLAERNVSDLEVITILEDRTARKTKRNKVKDNYSQGYYDWSYCIEVYDIDNNKIRIIISFNEDFLLIITVIRIEDHYD